MSDNSNHDNRTITIADLHSELKAIREISVGIGSILNEIHNQLKEKKEVVTQDQGKSA